MKGIIFNLFEEMVEGEGGAAAWDELLDAADLDGGYSAIGNYPSGDLVGLTEARSRQTGDSDHEVLRSFGHSSLLSLARGFPAFFTPHRRTRDFLLTLNDVIHPQVQKLHAAARPPKFDFTVIGEDELRIVYRSHRQLCAMAEGMIAGAATYFEETAHIVHEQCLRSGATQCTLHCTFRERSDVAIADASV